MGRLRYESTSFTRLAMRLGEVANTLELGGYLESGNGLTQIPGHRLAAEARRRRIFFSASTCRCIDLRIPRNDGFGKHQIARGDRLDSVGEHVLGKAAHASEIARELFEILRE